MRVTERGVAVASIAPTALLALWAVTRGGREAADYHLLATPGRVDLFRTADGRPVAWMTASADPDEVVRALTAEVLAPSSHVDGEAGAVKVAEEGAA